MPVGLEEKRGGAGWLGMDTGRTQASIGLPVAVGRLVHRPFRPNEGHRKFTTSSEADATGVGSAFDLSQCVAVITLFQQFHVASSLHRRISSTGGGCQNVHAVHAG